MNLTVVFAHLLLKEILLEPFGFQIAGNAVGVGTVRFCDSVGYAGVLRQIAVCVLNGLIRMNQLQTVKERPSHDSHKSFCAKGFSALDLQINLSLVIGLVTGLAEGDEVVRRVSAGTAALQVMDVEHRILGFAQAVPACMSVAPKHVFAHVPEAELFTLLITDTGYIRVLNGLQVETCRFDRNGRYGQKTADLLHQSQM